MRIPVGGVDKGGHGFVPPAQGIQDQAQIAMAVNSIGRRRDTGAKQRQRPVALPLFEGEDASQIEGIGIIRPQFQNGIANVAGLGQSAR